MTTSNGDKKRGALAVGLALAGFLAVTTVNLGAKTRTKGVEVVVQRADGTVLAGELLAVQGRTLVVSDRVSARDVTVGIEDIRAVRVVREANVLKRAMNGFLYAGAPAGALILLGNGDTAGRLAAVAGIGGVGALIAALRGVAKGADVTAVLNGTSEKKTDFVLKKLGAMALFQGALPSNFDGVGRQPKLGASLAAKDGRFEDLTVLRPVRFHLSFEPGYIMPRAEGAHIGLFKKMDFGDTHPGESFLFIRSGPTAYPRRTSVSAISLRGFAAEYSLNRSFAVGFAYASLGKATVKGFRMIPVTWRGEAYYSELYVTADSAGEGYFLTAAWKPAPDLFFNKYSFKLGMELGLCAARVRLDTSEYAFGAAMDKRSVAKTVPAAGIVAGLDGYYGRNLSLGVWARYRYASVRIGASGLNGAYITLSEQADVIDVPIAVAFPAHKVDLGGPAAGVSLGLHF